MPGGFMYSEIVIPENLNLFKPYPVAAFHKEYSLLPLSEKQKRIAKAEKYLDYSFSAIPLSLYMEYSQNGNRSNFEAVYFQKRYAFNALVLGECVEHKGRFIKAVADGLISILEESAWQLPAHNSYFRSGPNYPVPDVTRPVIDLFAAETAASVATAYYLLKEELDKISPFIGNRVVTELNHRIYTPYMTHHFWWMGDGDEPMCNWTVWCTQNVLLSVFLTDAVTDSKPVVNSLDFTEFKKEVLKKACYSADCFLKDYGEDGCCDEGAHYYKRSALCLFNLTEIMNAVTEGAFKKVYSVEKIKNIATYIFMVNASGKYYHNYADCSAIVDPMSAREFLFAEAVGDVEMMRSAALDHKTRDNEVNEEDVSLYNQLQDMFTEERLLSFDTSVAPVHHSTFFESVGLFIANDDVFSLSVKAGDNDDSHNHNDTGSLIVYKNGHPVLIDVGVETYSTKTFSDKRYEIWTMQSAYHNLPTINGELQCAGAKYKACGVEHFISSEISDIKMDIAECYPKTAGVKHYRRHVSLYKNKQIVIEDSVEFSGNNTEYALSLMLYDKPEISGNKLKLENSIIQILGNAIISFETIPITDARLKWAWSHDIYRVTVIPASDKLMITVS